MQVTVKRPGKTPAPGHLLRAPAPPKKAFRAPWEDLPEPERKNGSSPADKEKGLEDDERPPPFSKLLDAVRLRRADLTKEVANFSNGVLSLVNAKGSNSAFETPEKRHRTLSKAYTFLTVLLNGPAPDGYSSEVVYIARCAGVIQRLAPKAWPKVAEKFGEERMDTLRTSLERFNAVYETAVIRDALAALPKRRVRSP